MRSSGLHEAQDRAPDRESGSTRVNGSTYHSNTTGGWTADGHAKWDIQNDGKGGGTWSLGGSPSI